MKRVVTLLLLALCLFDVRAQSREELIEAYNRGTLTQEHIESLKAQYGLSDEIIHSVVRRGEDSRARRHRNTPLSVDAATPRPASERIVEDSALSGNDIGPRAHRPDHSFEHRTIFGHDIFHSTALSFEPNLTIATPENYRLGPGDEIIIDLWGDTQQTLRLEVSPEGYVIMPDVGPVFVSGMTIKEAERRLRHSLNAIYEGLAAGGVDLMLSLGNIRSITVDILGEVVSPGRYTLPSLATVLHALHTAAGANHIGSIRDIGLWRDGKQIARIDLYDYILSGSNAPNKRLQDGDVIIVPPAKCIVDIAGQVKRPMCYEINQDESLADAIRFAGDFASQANRRQLGIVRRQGDKHQSYTVVAEDYDSFMLVDGDSISVGGGINLYENRVEVRGAVYREGFYSIDDKVQSVSDLLRQADGLRPDAFKHRAMLYRQQEELLPEVLAIDLEALLAKECDDVLLRPNDILVVASVEDIKEDYTVSIYGAVGRAGDYPYAEHMTIESLIIEAGGLREEASTVNVIVTRRIKRPTSLNAQEELFETFVVNLTEGLTISGEEFELKPFDQVFVRRSPVYITQSSVTVEGEVAFAGKYPLLHRNMRLSEIIADAGYPTKGAFVEGAFLLRKITDEERAQREALQQLLDMQREYSSQDSLSVAGIKLSTLSPVGINLAEALAHPYSDADIVLRDGDLITVPKYNGTVRVMGKVLYPNAVTFKEGRPLRYYINAAGGFGHRARKSHTFVIYMNGMVESGLSAKVRPGCIIIVPSKAPIQPLRWNEIIGMLSASASTAAVIMSAINIANN